MRTLEIPWVRRLNGHIMRGSKSGGMIPKRRGGGM